MFAELREPKEVYRFDLFEKSSLNKLICPQSKGRDCTMKPQRTIRDFRNVFSEYLSKMVHILAKNLKGGSVKHEIWCEEQLDCAE